MSIPFTINMKIKVNCITLNPFLSDRLSLIQGYPVHILVETNFFQKF